jgi:hypothetical protein
MLLPKWFHSGLEACGPEGASLLILSFKNKLTIAYPSKFLGLNLNIPFPLRGIGHYRPGG